MIAAYIPVDDVDTICDRVGCADFDRTDLSESHYRTLVERIGQLEAQLDGARVAAAALERQLTTDAFARAEVTCDRLAGELGHGVDCDADDEDYFRRAPMSAATMGGAL